MRSRWRYWMSFSMLAAVTELGAPALARAQSPRTTVIITVRDSASRASIGGVQLRVAPGNVVQRTDSTGRAVFAALEPGSYTIEARRVGYRRLATTVAIAGEDSIQLSLALMQVPAELNPVVVERQPLPSRLREFEERRKRGLGQFVTAGQIDSSFGASLDAIIVTRIRGVRVVGDNTSGYRLMSLRPATEHAFMRPVGPCWPVVYLDGVQLADGSDKGPDIAIADTWSIGGIEYYSPSEVPVQYRQSGALGGGPGGSREAPTSPSCGVMLIWTRP